MKINLTSYKICIVLLVIYVALSQTTTITYAPAPAINTTRIVNISVININETKSITSQKLQLLEVVYVSGTNKTRLQFKSFNRTVYGNLQNYTISNLAGNWTVLKISPNTLSCQAIIENNTKNFSLLRFDHIRQRFSIALNLS